MRRSALWARRRILSFDGAPLDDPADEGRLPFRSERRAELDMAWEDGGEGLDENAAELLVLVDDEHKRRKLHLEDPAWHSPLSIKD